jgi:stearoyl-CoA desaturase (delta-9 desaturase)
LYADDSTGLSISTLFSKLDWTVTIWLVVSTFFGIIAPFFIGIQLKTAILAFIMFYVGGIGITSGYHRLWSHRSYDAHPIVKAPLLVMATWTFEGSCFSWCHDHRIHHRFTDTIKDPYNAKRGFFHSHIGWMFWRRDAWGPEFHEIVQTDISDLQADPLLQFQHRYYAPLAIFFGLIMPTLIAGFGWGDWLGGLLIAGFTKAVFIQQFTFFINSLAHYWGDATYSDQRTPRDSIFVSLWTWGEGFHNFHHEFPYDYRNGLLWYHYDPGMCG